MVDRIILHIDMDAFFIAVEQRDNPLLRGKAAAVCGSLSRSVVTSATYEARPFGIRAGMPIQEAKRRCPHLILVEGNHSKYTEVSARIFSYLKDYTPCVEVASIDEAYLDITESQLLFQSSLNLARSIKSRILVREGLTCSIGIAPNKLLAKLGSRLKKPDGLVVIAREEVEGLLKGSSRGQAPWNRSEARRVPQWDRHLYLRPAGEDPRLISQKKIWGDRREASRDGSRSR